MPLVRRWDMPSLSHASMPIPLTCKLPAGAQLVALYEEVLAKQGGIVHPQQCMSQGLQACRFGNPMQTAKPAKACQAQRLKVKHVSRQRRPRTIKDERNAKYTLDAAH